MKIKVYEVVAILSMENIVVKHHGYGRNFKEALEDGTPTIENLLHDGFDILHLTCHVFNYDAGVENLLKKLKKY